MRDFAWRTRRADIAQFPKVDPHDDVTALAAGWIHACAAKGGRVFCWGNDGHGQLGTDAVETHSPTPLLLPWKAAAGGTVTALTAKTLAAGGAHACAATSDTETACWGANDAGQLSDETQTNRSRPVTVLHQAW